ncbi:MAG: hypothetical protein KJ952_06410, partial [Candidatus Omnitrophica bacterium]|nr:hypothetical protein [Candidatus Omnitrophota bacterium]
MNRIKYLVVIFVLVFLPISSFAEVDLKTGAYLRLRHEYWKNIFDQDSSTKDNRNYFRVKSSLWGKLAFSDNVTLYSKLTDEFRAYAYYMQPSGKKRLNFDIDEVV